MGKIVIIGDSFCQHNQDGTWTRILATMLNLKLESRGIPAGSFWETREFLQIAVNADTEYIVVAHTDYTRIPAVNWNLSFGDLSKTEISELGNLVNNAREQYYRYIYVPTYHIWAQQQWFKEFSTVYSNFKLINLHCFPTSWSYRHLLKGMNIGPVLAALSLNEIGATDQKILGNDNARINHFNPANNQTLAEQLYTLLINYKEGDAQLDASAFEQKTTRWIDNWDL